MTDLTSFCNQDYCVCNPETSIDQACPFELYTKIDCSANATTAGDSATFGTIVRIQLAPRGVAPTRKRLTAKHDELVSADAERKAKAARRQEGQRHAKEFTGGSAMHSLSCQPSGEA